MSNLKVVMLRGLPGSGKSTWAKELVENESGKWIRLNKDSLRNMLHNGIWSRSNEKVVMELQRAMACNALEHYVSVIIDDTNYHPKYEQYYRKIAEHYGASFEIKVFDVPVEECIRRDLLRSKPVGKDVILRMFHQYLCEPPRPMVEGLPRAIIVDIDGTLAKMKDRGPFEWDKVGQDELNKPVKAVIDALQIGAVKLLIVSGRDEVCRKETEQWLFSHGIMETEMFMRPAGSHEKDSIVKRRIWEEHIKDKYNVVAVFDDRPQVVRLWRSLGLFVFDCGNGYEF